MGELISQLQALLVSLEVSKQEAEKLKLQLEAGQSDKIYSQLEMDQALAAKYLAIADIKTAVAAKWNQQQNVENAAEQDFALFLQNL